MRAGVALAAVAAAMLLAAPATASAAAVVCVGAYDPADQPPFGGESLPALEPRALDAPAPAGMRLDARQAIALADSTDAVRDEREESPSMAAEAYTRGPCLWEVRYFTGEGAGRTQVAQALISDPERSVIEAWRDHQVEVKLARGYPGASPGS